MFVCNKCGECCKNLPAFSVVLLPSDIDRISKSLKITRDMFISEYCDISIAQLGSKKILLYFLKITQGQCCFLQDRLCSINSQKPYQCQNAPEHFLSPYHLWSKIPCVVCGDAKPQSSKKFDWQIAREYLD